MRNSGNPKSGIPVTGKIKLVKKNFYVEHGLMKKYENHWRLAIILQTKVKKKDTGFMLSIVFQTLRWVLLDSWISLKYLNYHPWSSTNSLLIYSPKLLPQGVTLTPHF